MSDTPGHRLPYEGYPEWSYTHLGSPPREERTPPPRMYYVCTTLGPQEWLTNYHSMVSAGVAWRNPGDGFSINVPDAATLFVDSGGYQAAVHFRDAYPYGPERLFEWAESIGADYVAGMDWACEEADELTSHPSVTVDPDDIASIPERIERSIDDQVEQLRVYQDGEWSFEFVPVVQGHTVEDYRYCARRLKQAGVASEYMGVGTVCKRASTDEIYEVLTACREELPHTAFHLFGATRNVWTDDRFWGKFVSADTHAWARNTPEGNWTRTKDDKRRAFAHYKEKSEDTILDIYDQPDAAVDDSGASVFEMVTCYGTGDRECACGTVIPAYGTDFPTGCRNCERTRTTRAFALMDDLDRINPPAARHETSLSQTALADGGGKSGSQTTLSDGFETNRE